MFKNPMQGTSAALYLQLPDVCIKVGHGPAVLAAGAGCLLSGCVKSHRCYLFPFHSPSSFWRQFDKV